ncbi:hypothetical protein OESDEN_12543 [Oesophagostomum dentatum]|uniref:Uncharacterized protein n=1 Tax=Oesophagostomum dentatum TaxID=61180 RepID=A0A0B1SQW5_OESDE|nr:hypothetical protein OESDEN_12543 [Oesophagostomum dentatum]
MDVTDVDPSASTCKRATREWKSKYKPATPPTMESMGVKFCTCPECSRYRQQGEITPMRTSAEIVAPKPSRCQFLALSLL